MRYDTLVEFISEGGKEEYDPETGGMKPTEPTKEKRFCSVNDLTETKKVELFGRMSARAISIHYQGKKIEADRVEIAKGRFKGTYKIEAARALRHKSTAIATELVSK